MWFFLFRPSKENQCLQQTDVNINETSFSELRSNISNTSDSVSSGYPNTEKRVENTARSGVFLTKFEVFGYPDETLSRVLDISSQSKQKLRSE